MVQFVYDRSAVPQGELLRLFVQYTDVAGTNKDADSSPTIEITDADGAEVLAASAADVIRLGLGYYKYELTVPSGFEEGTWHDRWVATLDGYQLVDTFSFVVNSEGAVDAAGSTKVVELLELGDEPEDVELSQNAIKNINILLKMLKARLRSTAFKPDGTPCNVFDDDDLIEFLFLSLSEFNATPTISFFTFDDQNTSTLFSDILTQGAMVGAWSGQAILESGREAVISDNGIIFTPPPVSSTINTQLTAMLADYRAKLKEIKRNLRPSARAISAGTLMATNVRAKQLRHRRENQII